MNTEQEIPSVPQRHQFSRLRLYYLLALSAIALSIVLGQFLVQHHLHEQESDARLINVAGRQRMLGQQLAKVALELRIYPDSVGRLDALHRLAAARGEWVMAQEALLHGSDTLLLPPNTDVLVEHLLAECRPHFVAMVEASGMLSSMLQADLMASFTALEPWVVTILEHERLFLAGMERTVYRLESVAAEKVARLKYTEFGLLAVALTVILLEILLIFMPTTRHISQTLTKLIKSEQDAQQMSNEIGALYNSLEASYEKISAISIPVSSPQLVAKADRGGNIVELFLSFTKMLERRPVVPGGSIAQLIGMEGDAADNFMDNLVDVVSDGRNWHEEVVIRDHSGDTTYLDIHVVPIYTENGQVAHLNIMAVDLTAKRLAEQGIYRKDRAEIERKINEQKFRSILVLEGQEEERKRIAMNIHDGIGQLLTSLKFQLASIDIGKHQEAHSKLDEINQLVGNVIQEVRRVTFNLNPPVLSDYGLAAGLKTLAQEIDRTSQAEVAFRNDTGFSQRMNSKVENNVFRIVQEALNNAIKYAASERIDLMLQHDDTYLVVTVRDFGRGFEKQATDTIHADFGHGFLNMRERAAYINGTLDIQSEKDRGTIVKLFVPLAENPIIL
ncbi:hypothetical protein GCM10007415_03130 [Parapedobacter pyrenivorans]|uniref:histidine kinase n=1 Tax=Parapedobacter pyrenivorans TaxID=1305674 RepID=A0A917HDK8_9SPHI|nr:ATP-binding protein [Parapedobacter pyrenivorans]GGG74939.1 hypothetical protein GCM10007415_03130 [Parapedobacter pyrenivorans]